MWQTVLCILHAVQFMYLVSIIRNRRIRVSFIFGRRCMRITPIFERRVRCSILGGSRITGHLHAQEHITNAYVYLSFIYRRKLSSLEMKLVTKCIYKTCMHACEGYVKQIYWELTIITLLIGPDIRKLSMSISKFVLFLLVIYLFTGNFGKVSTLKVE